MMLPGMIDWCPDQSAKSWVASKDRFIRQAVLQQIENETGRSLIVFYARKDQGIFDHDPDDIADIISTLKSGPFDIILQTPGGDVDAVEKLASIFRKRNRDFRVIAPSWAKSGGTLIALASREIILGLSSELGPIDPQLNIKGLGYVPAEIIAQDEKSDPILRRLAASMVERATALAERLLGTGMLREWSEQQIKALVEKLATHDSYKSHGAVIDFEEARTLGLKVTWLEPECRLWKLIWLLFSLYEHDAARDNLGKIYETATESISRRAS